MILVASCIASAASGVVPASAAEPAHRLRVSLLIAHESISLHEPVEAVLEIRNGLEQPLHFDLGSNAKGFLVVSLIRPDGKTVSSRLPQAVEDFSEIGELTLAAGQVYRQSLVLNEWDGFDQVGDYQVGIAVPPPVDLASCCDGQLSAEGRVRITSRDPVRLKQTCERLQEVALLGKPDQAREAARALGFVADDICVSSLGRVLRESFLGRESAVQALGRLGTAAAISTLVDAWDGLDAATRTRALSEFDFVGRGELLRDALRRAGKKMGKS